MHRWLNKALMWKILIISSFAVAVLWSVFPELWESPFLLVGDDARHFVVWLRQMSNPELFPSDPIAENFHAITPVLYSVLYWPAAKFGIDVLTWQFLVVVPLTFSFLVLSSYRILSHILAATTVEVGFATFIFCTILAKYAIEGLPRTFAVSIIFFSLSVFLNKNGLLLMIVMFIGACLYPAAVIISGFTMVCYMLLSIHTSVSNVASNLKLIALAGTGGILGLAFFLYGAAEAGPTMLLAEARDLPIFSVDGRTSFFRDSFINQILCKGRGGLLPICVPGRSDIAALSTLVITVGTFVFGYYSLRYLSKKGNSEQRNSAMQLLLAMILAGLFLFTLSYLIAFRAHLPSRYVQYSIRLVFDFSIVFTVIALINRVLENRPDWASALSGNFARNSIFLSAWILTTTVTMANVRNQKDNEPAISQFLRQTPIETTVAGIGEYIDNVPAFTNRSVYVALELFVPYKRRYYYEMAQRVGTLKKLYSTPVNAEFAEELNKSGIDYLLISQNMSKDSISWTQSFPELRQIVSNNTFSQDSPTISNCTVVFGVSHFLIDTLCLREAVMSR